MATEPPGVEAEGMRIEIAHSEAWCGQVASGVLPGISGHSDRPFDRPKLSGRGNRHRVRPGDAP